MPFRKSALGAASTVAFGADAILKQGGRGAGRSWSAMGSRANQAKAAATARMPQVGRSAGATATRRAGAANMGHVSGANATALQGRPGTAGRWRAAAGAAMPGKPRRSSIGVGAGLGGLGVGSAMGGAIFSGNGRNTSRPGPSVNQPRPTPRR